MVVIGEEGNKNANDERGSYHGVDESKECCCKQLKCWQWLIIVVLSVAAAGGLIGGLVKHYKGKTTSATDTAAATPTAPSPTPYPGVILQGYVLTTENYTAALEEPSSAAYQKLEQDFVQAMRAFYDTTDYNTLYDRARVTSFERSGLQAGIHFEVYLTQLDNDQQLPDARTVLNEQLTNERRLGRFNILSATLDII